MKFIVDRRTWYRGKGSDASKLLLANSEMRCCIGFVGKQLGIDDEDLRGVAEVTALNRDVWCNYPAWMSGPSMIKPSDGLTLIGQAYLVNDDENITDEQREARLKELFAEAGDEIEFIN